MERCSECKFFKLITVSNNEGHCTANPPIPVKWKHTAESRDITTVEVVQFGPSRTFGERWCGLWEKAPK